MCKKNIEITLTYDELYQIVASMTGFLFITENHGLNSQEKINHDKYYKTLEKMRLLLKNGDNGKVING